MLPLYVLIFIIVFIGINGLAKGNIKISRKKELRGQNAKTVSIILVLIGISIPLSAISLSILSPLFYLIIGIAFVVLVVLVTVGEKFPTQ